MPGLRAMRTLALLALLAGISACTANRGSGPTSAIAIPLAPSPSKEPPLLIHLPGVSGESAVDHDLVRGLKQGDVPAEIEIYDWTCNDPGIPALHAYARNQDQATKIAAMIARIARIDPSRKIYITSHSGGAGLAVWALEKLPMDVQVDTLLMLAPALSPSYDLSLALAHVRGKAYAFYSKLDTFVLGTGTRLLGTIDGVNTDAAGQIGFVRPPAGDAAQYAKLVQEAYDPAWMRYGNFGDHIGWTASPFARAVLAPLVGGHAAVNDP